MSEPRSGMPISNAQVVAILRELKACPPAVERVEAHGGTAKQMWETWDSLHELLWVAAQLLGARVVVLCACDFARTALPFVPEGEERPLWPIEAAEGWCRGNVSAAEVAEAAWAAVWAGAWAARSAAKAAWAAVWAARAAADTADAAEAAAWAGAWAAWSVAKAADAAEAAAWAGAWAAWSVAKAADAAEAAAWAAWAAVWAARAAADTADAADAADAAKAAWAENMRLFRRRVPWPMIRDALAERLREEDKG